MGVVNMARVAKSKEDKMDALIYAINRLAESQEKANELISESHKLHEKNHELNMKQYTLNLDSQKFNLERAEISDKRNAEEREDFAALIGNIKQYVDETNQNTVKAIQGQISILLSAHHNLEKKLEKADQEQIAKSMLEKIKSMGISKGTI